MDCNIQSLGKELLEGMYGDISKVTLSESQMITCINICRAIILAKVYHPEDENLMWEDLGMCLEQWSDEDDVIKQRVQQ
tara:strand:+ start:301 stop:537 length:237 start_codon:yes stop_codon:yes gene_type:complete